MNKNSIKSFQTTRALTGTSAVILQSRPNRVGLILTLQSILPAGFAHIALGPTAVLGEGIYLTIGGSYSQGPDDYTGIVSAMAGVNACTLSIMETYYED